MKCLVDEAAGRLHECAGQEILDLIESISTGGYEDAVQGPQWSLLVAWAGEKYESVQKFIAASSDMPLGLRKLSDFDRALAVQDYRDHMASFSLVGLGFTYTSKLLREMGVVLLEGAQREDWRNQSQAAAARISGTGNESDVAKNAEAREGLKVCRTVCVYRYSLRALTGQNCGVEPTAVTSGPASEAFELGLFAAVLRHPRGGDSEFQALQACARACLQDLGCNPIGAPPLDGSAVEGELWLHVSEVPCLSCVGAMAQFRKMFPDIKIHIAFNLGRQPSQDGTSAA